jgi:hypothetical protein
LVVAYRDLGWGGLRPYLVLHVTGINDIKPCFVHGCQNALWGRADLMQHFDIAIMERRQRFSLTRCD